MLEPIRVFVWSLTATVDRVVCTGERGVADYFAVAGMDMWAAGVAGAAGRFSSAVSTLVAVFGLWLGWTYVVDRRRAERVRRSRERAARAGVLHGPDVRVEVPLAASERIVALGGALAELVEVSGATTAVVA